MNSRERMLAAFRRQPVDRVPTDIWAVAEVRQKLRDRFGGDEPMRAALHIDGMAGVSAKYVGPALPKVADDETINYWGIRTKRIHYGYGDYDETAYHPLAGAKTLDDLEAYAWPKSEWFDCSEMPPAARRHRRTRAVLCGYMAPFTYHIYLRGLENALMDPMVDPEFTHHFLRRLADSMHDCHRRMFQACAGLIDVTHVTDDYGMQTGPLMSLATFREFYRPHLRRFVGLAKEFGILVFHHDDGAMREFLPDLLDDGIDVLNPIQWRCPGMEMEGLKRDFGARLAFHGGIDNQKTLPFGGDDDVRKEVRRAVDVLAADKTGYVLAPCHNIQANTPMENILAMYDEAYRYGRF